MGPHLSRKLMALLFIVAIAAAATGCGGGGGDDSLTKAEFIEQADAICKQGEKERVTGIKSSGTVSNSWSRARMAAFQRKMLTTVVVPSIETESQQLAELTAPSGEEAKVGAIIKANKEVVAKVKKNPDSIENGAQEKFDKLAKAYGLKVCPIL